MVGWNETARKSASHPAGGYDALAFVIRRIANSTRIHSAAATRRPSGRRPVQVSRVLSRPGETHSPGTYVVSGDLGSGAGRWGVPSGPPQAVGWALAHPTSARPTRVPAVPGSGG